MNKEFKRTTHVILEGFENQKIELDINLFRGPWLLINGHPAPSSNKRGEMILTRDDGTRVIAGWKPQMFGLDIPQLVLDGKPISIADSLKWYQWTWASLPLILLLIGGLVGGVLGALAFIFNARIFRSNLPGFPKFMISGSLSALAYFLWIMLSALLSVFMGGGS